MKIQFVAALLLGMANLADAHFVWVVPAPGGATAQVFISEDLKPSDEVDVGIIGGARLSLRDAEGREIPLTLSRSGPAYATPLSGHGARLVHGSADLGLTARGQEKPYLLVYYPKTILGDAFDPKAAVGNAAPVEILPVGHAGSLHLKVLAHGKPLPASEVTIILPDGAQKKLTTDADGLTAELTQTGRYGAWARYWENVGGERDGKAYAETRNYATLVFDAADSAPASAAATRFASSARGNGKFRSRSQRRVALRLRRTYCANAQLFDRCGFRSLRPAEPRASQRMGRSSARSGYAGYESRRVPRRDLPHRRNGATQQARGEVRYIFRGGLREV